MVSRTAIALLLLLVSAACGRLGFDEEPGDAGTVPIVDPCPGTALDCAGAVSCHDFEAGDFDGWGYVCNGDDYQCGPDVAEVELTVVESPPCNGNRVYRAFTTGGPGSRQNAYLGEYVKDAPVQDLFVRFALRYPANTNYLGRGIVLAPLMPSGTKGSPRLELGDKPGEMRLDLFDQDHVFAAPLAADEWACIELHLGTASADVWVDGEPVFHLDGPTVPDGAAVDIVTLGITASASAGPTEIFFDDFALSTSRIGCVAP